MYFSSVLFLCFCSVVLQKGPVSLLCTYVHNKAAAMAAQSKKCAVCGVSVVAGVTSVNAVAAQSEKCTVCVVSHPAITQRRQCNFSRVTNPYI